MRFYINYPRIIEVTMYDAFPVHRADECIDFLKKAEMFSTPDTCSVYLQIKVDEADRCKTDRGPDPFVRMLFGLKTTSGTFQYAMNVIRRPVI